MSITLPLIIHIIILLVLAFRIMLFTGRGRRRPVIAWLAYITMVAAFTEVIFAATGTSQAPGAAGLLLEFVLALAIYCHGGNVAELFKSSDGSRLGRWLCWVHLVNSKQPGQPEPPPPPSPPAPPQPRQHNRRKSDRQHNSKVTS